MLVVMLPDSIEMVELLPKMASRPPLAKKAVNQVSTWETMLEAALRSARISPMVTFSKSKSGFQNSVKLIDPVRLTF
jgi:hypothetical protein